MNETRRPDGDKLLGAGGRIAVHARQRILEPQHRIVDQRLVQPRHRSVADHPLVHEVARRNTPCPAGTAAAHSRETSRNDRISRPQKLDRRGNS